MGDDDNEPCTPEIGRGGNNHDCRTMSVRAADRRATGKQHISRANIIVITGCGSTVHIPEQRVKRAEMHEWGWRG